MEKQNEEGLLRSRSAGACIKDGFKQYTSSFKRTFKATWLFSLIFAIISGLSEALFVTFYPIIVASLLIVYLLFYFLLIRRRLTFIGRSGATSAIVFRHFGLIATVDFVAFIVCAIIWLLTSVPAVILGIANIQAQTGAAYGDPLGMPSYMTWFTVVVFTLASFMQAYIYLAFFFPQRYALGSAVANEQERQRFNKKE